MSKKKRERTVKHKTGVYIHIPFCISKCGYCDFNSYANRNELIDEYVKAIIKQIGEYKPLLGSTYTADTVYIGGGTPTSIGVSRLSKILNAVRQNIGIDPAAEITCEHNPAAGDKNIYKDLLSEGINRLSIGMQSRCDNELEILGRRHTFAEFVASFCRARDMGFDNISVDFMMGIPEQTMDTLESTAMMAAGLFPDHISAYLLKIEPGTPFYEQRNSLKLPTEDEAAEMYSFVCGFLKDRGYEQYEISNFARPSKQSRHSLKYWNCQEYLGFGCGAHSYFCGKRFSFMKDIDGYIKNISSGAAVVDFMEDISGKDEAYEYAMLRLRLTSGINKAEFYRKFHYDLYEVQKAKIDRYVEMGLMENSLESIKFTTRGFLVSNTVLADLLILR